jgi:hypothetical protein
MTARWKGKVRCLREQGASKRWQGLGQLPQTNQCHNGNAIKVRERLDPRTFLPELKIATEDHALAALLLTDLNPDEILPP